MIEADRGDSLGASIERILGIGQVWREMVHRRDGADVTLNIATEEFDRRAATGSSEPAASDRTV